MRQGARKERGAHPQGAAKDGGLDHPVLAIDYGFLKDGAVEDTKTEGEEDETREPKEDDTEERERHGGTPVLFGTEAKYGLSLAMAVRGKGSADEWVARRWPGGWTSSDRGRQRARATMNPRSLR